MTRQPRQLAHGGGPSAAVSLTSPKPSTAVVVRDLAGGRPELTQKLVIFLPYTPRTMAQE
jgi:hypothetical protein